MLIRFATVTVSAFSGSRVSFSSRVTNFHDCKLQRRATNSWLVGSNSSHCENSESPLRRLLFLFIVESCSMDLLRNGLRSFVSLEVISVNADGHVYVINEEELQSFCSLLFYCKV